MNLFFGGYGSVEDIKWDVAQSRYGTREVVPPWDPNTDHQWKVVGTTDNDGGPCNRQQVSINQVDEDNVVEIDSRDSYTDPSDGLAPCTLRRRATIGIPPYTEDARRIHVRLWDGGLNAVDGYWSVGAVHWDPDRHDDGSRYVEYSEVLFVAVFMTGGADPQPLWFVGDIWEFPVPGNGPTGLNNDSAGCGRDYHLVQCDGEAHYVLLIA